MTTYVAAPVPFDSLASKVQYTWPEGDANVVESRQTLKFRADRQYYGPGDTARLLIFSNGMCLDPANSYFTFNLRISLTGANVPNINQYDVIRPILMNGVEDLIAEWRVLSYGGTEMEKIRMYNYASNLRQWMTIPTDNGRKLARANLKGDCLNPAERFQIMDISMSNGNLGLKVIFRPEMSGFFDTKRLIPLRYLNQITFEMRLERAENAFACGGVINPEGSGEAAGIVPNINYQISNLEFVSDCVTLSPEMELAMEKTVNDKEGLPIFFDTFEVQQDPVTSTQSYTQTINKSVANAVRVMTTMVPQYQVNNPLLDSFASEPMGLKTYQYRLGTTYYPKDAVDLQADGWIRAAVEADKAVNYSNAKREMPPSDLREQIGERLWANLVTPSAPSTLHSGQVANTFLLTDQPFSSNAYFYPGVPQSSTNETIAATRAGSTVPPASTTLNVALYNSAYNRNYSTDIGVRPTWDSTQIQFATSNLVDHFNSTNYQGVMTGPAVSASGTGRSAANLDSLALISNHGYGSSIDKESIYQLYLPHPKAIPSKFRIGTSLQQSPDAWVSGVSTAHGHQLQLYITRYTIPSAAFNFFHTMLSSLYPQDLSTGPAATIAAPTTAAQTGANMAYSGTTIAAANVAKSAPTLNSTSLQSGLDVTHGAQQVGSAVSTVKGALTTSDTAVTGYAYACGTDASTSKGGQKNTSVYSWGANDNHFLITYLQYTRLILIGKNYNITIRE